ncbi:hypothetical protein ACMXYW_08965 [Neptuniibacter sp. QD48_55]|uniref:hypothetical protein n=1 Tax=Neptuniibacter sp. QD48_55 TaxID=3398212 RepID=UPI0039F600F9
MKLQLIKDIKDYRAVFYWCNSKGKRHSPMMPTLVHAYEWHLQFQRGIYKGKERRKNRVDRRLGYLLENKNRKNDRRYKQKGRRFIDTALYVSKDLYSEKIAALKKLAFESNNYYYERKSA